MRARYDGECVYCKRFYDAGTEIVALRPRGKRRRWLKYHRACHKLLAAGISLNPVTVRYGCPRCGGEHHRDDCQNESAGA